MYSSRYFSQIVIKPKFSRQIFEKYSNTKFHENPSSGSRVIACRLTDTWADRRTDMAKLIASDSNFAPEKKVKLKDKLFPVLKLSATS
jgi:hypothetical protein